MSETIRAGLYCADQQVALQGVGIEARMQGPCLHVTVSQRYRNTEDVPIEAVYVFPLAEDAAVCGFAARIGEAVVKGRVEEREKAFALYDDAMLDGHGAYLLDQERPNVFTASVGNLPPGETVTVEIQYVSQLRMEGDAWRLTFPTTVAPRYVPLRAPVVGQQDGERVNPEQRWHVPYGLTFALTVDGAFGLAGVSSPSHPLQIEFGEAGARIELAQADTALDRDLVLLVRPKSSTQPQALLVEESDGSAMLMLNYRPSLPADVHPGREITFLVDCSGSMGGTSIIEAKRALQLCIRALSAADRFNVVCFGSRFEAMWPTALPFSETTLQQASTWVEAIDARLGGTELLPALDFVLSRPRDGDVARAVLLLTDGQVSNEHEVLSLAGTHAAQTSIFSLGIGASASEHLVRGVARASRGECEMIYPGERIEPKVLRTFSRLRGLRNLNARLELPDTGAIQAPFELPPLFEGDTLCVFARLEHKSVGDIAMHVDGQRWHIPVTASNAHAASASSVHSSVALCWARARIRDYEEGNLRGSAQVRTQSESVKHALVELGQRYGLLSSATSYVAIEERPPHQQAAAELRRIPVALATGWGGLASPVVGRTVMPAARSHAPARFVAYDMEMVPHVARRSNLSAGRVAGRVRSTPSLGHFDMSRSMAADELYSLLMAQKADGSFGDARRVMRWLRSLSGGFAEIRLQAASAEYLTAVVLAVLPLAAADRKEEWQPAADKAQRWLASQPTVPDVTAQIVAAQSATKT